MRVESRRDRCDLSQNGVIDKPELMPALALWNQLAKEHLAEQKLPCCAIS